MKKKQRLIACTFIGCIILFIHTEQCRAQSEYSSRALALGNCDVALAEHAAVFQNPAALALLQNSEAGININRHYLLRELDHMSFSAGITFGKSGTLGFGISRFGYALYEEKKGGICWSRKFGSKCCAAVQLGFQDVKIGEGIGHHAVPLVKVGFLLKLAPVLWMGALVDNPEHAKLSESIVVPTVFKIGMQLLLSEKVNLYAQGTQQSAQPVFFSGGVEYHTTGEFFLRLGIRTEPLAPSFGFGFTKFHCRADIAATWHPVLGVSPSVAFTYVFTSNK